MNSPLKWVGGKSRLRKEVIAAFPSDADCYCEVFGGAAWVLFWKPRHGVEVLNDVNDELVNLWRIIKWRPAELLEAVERFPYSRTLHQEIRVEWGNSENELDRAVRLYLLIHTSFGAHLEEPEKASFGYWKTVKKTFHARVQRSLEQAFERITNVLIENLDFEECIKKYDQPRTLFYCDPPYYDTTTYEHSLEIDDYYRLRDTLKNIQGKFLLNINDCEFTRVLFQGFFIEEGLEKRSLARDPNARDSDPILFVSNYDSVKQLGLF